MSLEFNRGIARVWAYSVRAAATWILIRYIKIDRGAEWTQFRREGVRRRNDEFADVILARRNDVPGRWRSHPGPQPKRGDELKPL